MLKRQKRDNSYIASSYSAYSYIRVRHLLFNIPHVSDITKVEDSARTSTSRFRDHQCYDQGE